MAQCLSNAQIASVSLMVMNHWKRNFQGFLTNSLLESGEGGYLPAFVIDCHLKSRPEIFDWLKEGNTRSVDLFGNKLEPLLQEDM